MKNKRGDIPITILVIGVFTICALAILSFFNSSIQTKNSFADINEMEKMNIQIERFNSGVSLGDLKAKEVNKDFIYLEKKEKWLWSKEKILFSVRYYFTPDNSR